MTEWVEVKDEVLKWEEIGQQLQGVLIDRRENEGFSPLYTLEFEEKKLQFYGHKILDERLKDKIGKLVRITFLGNVKGVQGREYKDFKIEEAKK